MVVNAGYCALLAFVAADSAFIDRINQCDRCTQMQEDEK